MSENETAFYKNVGTIVAGRPSVTTSSDSIQWAPISSPERLNFIGTSKEAVSKALTEAFGSFPIRLSKAEHLAVLKGMMLGAGDGAMPFKELYLALNQFGQLEVTLV